MNAIRIFNDKGADELIFLDVFATKEQRCVDVDLVKKLGDECHMPFTVGGGINSISQIRKLIQAGAEKVAINYTASKNPSFIKEASREFGSSTIVVSMDVKKKLLGGKRVHTLNASQSTSYSAIDYARMMEDQGAGELLVNSVDRDGMMCGYDSEMIKSVSEHVDIPVIACGGAGSVDDLVSVVKDSGASAAAAGSLFVFHGPRRAVLINLPDNNTLRDKFKTVQF